MRKLFDVKPTKPNPKAKKDCPRCSGQGYYMAINIGEYEEMSMRVKCNCSTGILKIR